MPHQYLTARGFLDSSSPRLARRAACPGRRMWVGALFTVLSMVVAAPLSAAPDPATQPAVQWSARLVDDVDWMAVIWNWSTADQATGHLLSLVVPVPHWTAANGTDAPKGPVLLAGRKMKDGSSALVVLLPANQVAPERARSAKSWTSNPPMPVPASQTTEPAMYLLGDLIAIGSPALLKSAVASAAPGHPLAALLLPDGDATVAAFRLRPQAMPDWAGALSFLNQLTSAAIRWDVEGGLLTLNAIVPMLAEEATKKAGILTDAAHSFDKSIYGAAPDLAHPIDSRTLAWSRMVSGTIFFPQKEATTITPASLRGRLQLPVDHVPGLLAAFVTFPTPRAAVQAYFLGRSTGCSVLFLASLTPYFRQQGADSGAFRLADLTKPEVGRSYYIDTASEGPDRAEYQLRIRDIASKTDVQTLQAIVTRQDKSWMIDLIRPQAPSQASAGVCERVEACSGVK
jgi:hypothetical protein